MLITDKQFECVLKFLPKEVGITKENFEELCKELGAPQNGEVIGVEKERGYWGRQRKENILTLCIKNSQNKLGYNEYLYFKNVLLIQAHEKPITHWEVTFGFKTLRGFKYVEDKWIFKCRNRT